MHMRSQNGLDRLTDLMLSLMHQSLYTVAVPCLAQYQILCIVFRCRQKLHVQVGFGHRYSVLVAYMYSIKVFSSVV